MSKRPIRLLRAFTLVELLVVIGILVVLIGILLPTLSRARAHGLDTACRARLQQIFNLQTYYANDNRGSYTPVATTGNTATPVIWSTRLSPYTRLKDDAALRTVFNCPSIAHEELLAQPGDRAPRTSYGLNSCIMMPTWAARVGRNSTSADLIFMGEKPANTDDFLTTDDGWHFVKDDANPENSMWWWYMKHTAHASYRHGGNKKHSNALMADGHVQAFGRVEMLKGSGKWFKDDGTEYSAMFFLGPCCDVPQ